MVTVRENKGLGVRTYVKNEGRTKTHDLSGLLDFEEPPRSESIANICYRERLRSNPPPTNHV
jgi:hypothetical protein